MIVVSVAGQAKEMRPAKSIAFLFPPPVPQNQDEKRKAKQKLRISSIHPIISKPRKGYKPRRLEAKDFADVLELLVPNEHSKGQYNPCNNTKREHLFTAMLLIRLPSYSAELMVLKYYKPSLQYQVRWPE